MIKPNIIAFLYQDQELKSKVYIPSAGKQGVEVLGDLADTLLSAGYNQSMGAISFVEKSGCTVFYLKPEIIDFMLTSPEFSIVRAITDNQAQTLARSAGVGRQLGQIASTQLFGWLR